MKKAHQISLGWSISWWCYQVQVSVLSEENFAESSVRNQVSVIILKRLSLLLVEISPQIDRKIFMTLWFLLWVVVVQQIPWWDKTTWGFTQSRKVYKRYGLPLSFKEITTTFRAQKRKKIKQKTIKIFILLWDWVWCQICSFQLLRPLSVLGRWLVESSNYWQTFLCSPTAGSWCMVNRYMYGDHFCGNSFLPCSVHAAVEQVWDGCESYLCIANLPGYW